MTFPEGGSHFEHAVESEPRGYQFNAVVILGGRIQKIGEEYVPSGFEQEDENKGLTAGELRIDGAVAAAVLGNVTDTFVFTGGRTSPLNNTSPGLVHPTEAEVYETAFLKQLEELRADPLYADRIPQQESIKTRRTGTSKTTFTDIARAFVMARENKWHHIGIMTNMYHEDRTKDFAEPFAQAMPVTYNVLRAETYAMRVFPDQWAKNGLAYLSPEGIERYRRRSELEEHGRIVFRTGLYNFRPEK